MSRERERQLHGLIHVLREEVAKREREIERLQRLVAAHHAPATLSVDVLSDYDERHCTVCAKAQ